MTKTEISAAPLRALIAEAVTRHAHRELLVLGDVHLTYREADLDATRMANVLADHGVGPGDRVVTLAGNGMALVCTLLACVRLGAVFAPLNEHLEAVPLGRALARIGGRAVVCDGRRLAALRPHREGPMPAAVIVADTGEPVAAAGERPDPAIRSMQRALAHAAPVPQWDDASGGNPAAPARLLSTSGTTGDAKVVVWSASAETLHAVHYAEELLRIEPGETVYSCLPLYHVTCQGTLLGTMLSGGRLVLDHRFDPLGFWRRTREAGAVLFPYVGTMITALLQRPVRDDDADNPVERAMGSATPAARWQEFEARFGITLEDVWGQTETASCWTRAVGARSVGTVGRPSDRFEARLVAIDEEPPVGTPGELWIRPHAPHVLAEGYLNTDGGVSSLMEASGWYRTGDLMSTTPDGSLRFHGRLRDAIRRRGETIAPAEIEAAAQTHPAVLEAAAVGVPAADGVEDDVMLWVVARPGSRLDPADLHAHLEQQLPRFMVPRYLRIADALPKTATTRIQRSALRAQGSSGAWDARPPRKRRG